MTYELCLRNKFLTLDAKSLDDIIGGLEGHVFFLKELRDTGKVQYSYGAEDDYATVVTEDEDVAHKYGFYEPDWDEDD